MTTINSIPSELAFTAYCFTTWNEHDENITPEIVTIAITPTTIVYLDTTDQNIKIAQWAKCNDGEEEPYRILPETIQIAYANNVSRIRDVISIQSPANDFILTEI